MTSNKTPDPLAYGPTGIPCGCGKDAHSNLVPCQPDPLTDQQLAEIDACVNGPLGTATDFDHTTVAPLVAEVRRLRAQAAAGRAQAWRDIADRADPAKPEISWFGDFGHQVGEWIRKQAEYEQRRLAAPAAVVSSADGTPGNTR